jgi:hypothetical protein
MSFQIANAGDMPNPNDVAAMAVYSALNYSSDISDDVVNYNITDPAVISSFFAGIENKRRDCSRLEADHILYLYVKYDSGFHEVFTVRLYNYKIIQRIGSDICYWLLPEARKILRNNMQ